MELSPRYNPTEVEEKWYQRWKEAGYFQPSMDGTRPTFCIVMPPPNVTGVLHLGHALNSTWQDILVRFHRMRQDNTLWLPGTDHAGIHTQMKVDELLRNRGQDRLSMGRQAFVQEVWQWKEQYGGHILAQMAKLGASVDWSRLRFTLDEGLSRAVTEVFVRLYEEGLLYRGNYITNWCVSCHTALSDIEVEHEEETGQLTEIAYELTSGVGEIVVATTRPETMLGDTAVAVHPDDPRYQGLVGQWVELPLLGRRIPIIADAYVDPTFGTGAVKVTPAHDPNDFEMGQRHHLDAIKVIGEDGRMTADAGVYAGLTREEARVRVLQDLQAAGRVRGMREIIHAVGHCEKCDTVIEPLLSLQWFVKMRPLAEPAIEAVRSNAVQFAPARFEKIYMNWLENIHDWCISRQIWWGHRIPAYYCDAGHVTVAREPVSQCAQCGRAVVQDEDVLDTWFSSALWPFSTLGWPDMTDDLKTFYPTSVLSTGYDIIFFWVARMIMQGIHFTGKAPFATVLLHGLVRDAEGRKMSKSLGNGVDPLEVIDRYGADALRIALVLGSAPGNDYRWSWERFEAGSHFANKVYNALRFVLMNRDDHKWDPGEINAARSHPVDQWIDERLNDTIVVMTRALEEFEFGQAARAIYDFFWDDYCDWYIEMAKVRLKSAERHEALETLTRVADRALKLLHPFMPFVTEELYHALRPDGGSIMVAPWPEPESGVVRRDAVIAVEQAQSLIRAGRNLRAEVGLAPGQAGSFVALADTPEVLARWQAVHTEAMALLRAQSLQLCLKEDAAPMTKAIASVVVGGTVYLKLEGLVDLKRERDRLEKAKADAEKERNRLASRLHDENFIRRAPHEVVTKTEENLKEVEARIRRLDERQALLQ
ncbi:MAG: valine--tRNA ligase [Sulfobacillus acidophilus]|uniref:Valine--tRNA ligase n=1 Tax=Sulfobacillus acidophilus TaxID=53633 RepID=A0A2T2WIP0_9FIRM|nr:MAG: valine--tRNA ligase [Sulfobacillus acidophilus]